MNKRNRVVLIIAGTLFLVIVVTEIFVPANVVGAYGFVLPILLVATSRNRKLMYLTVALCILATYIGLLRPTKPGRFVSALINRTVVVCVLGGVAYIGMTWEERKAREEAARAALALQTENLLRANAQLSDIRDQLNRSERLAAVGQLVASVAHEVGTPLHSIAWHVQALGEEPAATPEMKKRIGVIDEQIDRVVRIIQELLSSTRQRKPEPVWLPVEKLVQPVASLMRPGYQAKGVSIQVDAPSSGHLVWADAEKLQQVLVNLLTNALAATPAGGAVSVLVEPRLMSGDEAERWKQTGRPPIDIMLLLTVTDTGCGMPKEDLQRAFEPFFTTKAIGKGTGLGLFLSHETILAHGGSLSIESEVGQGTKVVIALPGLKEQPVGVV
ncbi:MAG: sensor histidine kinase [Nitrospiraceae bacterium]